MNNKSEAKVPNDEGNWQSIEIYLFSNGQQYSPPRKYHLQAEELNWWDATLNHLARSHYGIQHPLIYLYTIDGRLVEGPLELKDGQAYVAVEPPATFIDAGYQKYLIRASRSWEKRQAKKKSQASDHTPPCCTCPDKESYRLPPCCTCPDNDCQLHGTCCLCPEKERAAFLEPLLPATPRRNSPGGQYVSSGHGKPIPPDPPADNGKAAEGEIGVRVGERRSVPCEETLRSGYESGVEESDLTSAGRGQRGGEHRPRPNDSNIPNEYEARLDESEGRPDDHGRQLGKSEISEEKDMVDHQDSLQSIAKVIRSSSFPSGEYKMVPNDDSTSPDKKINLTSKQEVKPTDYEVKLGEKEPRTCDVRPELDESVAGTDESETSLDENRDTRHEDAVKLTEQRPIPTKSNGEPERDQDEGDEGEVHQPETDVHEGIFDPDGKMSEHGSIIQENSKSDQHRSGSDESGFKTDDHVPSTHAECRSHNYAVNSRKIKEKPGETGPKSSGRGSMQDSEKELEEEATRPDKYSNMLGEHEGNSNENDDRSEKHNLEKEDKEYETNNALGKQEEKISENKRKDSKPECGMLIIMRNFLTDNSSPKESPLGSTGSTTKIRKEIERKRRDSELISEQNDNNIVSGVTTGVNGGREAKGKENQDEPQRKSPDHENKTGERGIKNKESESSSDDPDKNKSYKNLQHGERSAEMEHAYQQGGTKEEPRAIEQEHASGLSEGRDREHEHTTVSREAARNGRVGEKKHNGRESKQRSGECENTRKVVPQRFESEKGEPDKEHKEHEHIASTLGPAQDRKGIELKTRQGSEAKGREHDITRAGELKAMKQENDKEMLDETGKEREHRDKAGEAAREGKEGKPKTRQQRNNRRPSEERRGEHEHSSTLVPHRIGEIGQIRKTETSTVQQEHDSGVPEKRHGEPMHGSSTVGTAEDGRMREPKTRQQNQGSIPSDAMRRENDVTRDDELRTAEPGHNSRRKPGAKQQENDKGALDEKRREREHASGSEGAARNVREGESRTRQQRNNVRPCEERSGEHEHSSTLDPHRSEETGDQVRKRDTTAVQQEHDRGAPEKKHRETKHGNSTVGAAQDSRETEPKTRQQGSGSRASEVNGKENDVTRDGEITIDEFGHNTIEGKARAMQKENDKEVLDERGREYEQGSRTGEPARSGKERESRTRKQRNNSKPGEKRSGEQEHTSTLVPHRTGETGDQVRKRETSAVQQEHDSSVPEKMHREPKHGSSTVGTAQYSGEREPETRPQESANGASEVRVRENHVTRDSELTTDESGRDTKGEKARALQHDKDNETLNEKREEREHVSRAEEAARNVREGDPRSRQGRNNGIASADRNGQHKHISKIVPQTSEDTGHHVRRGESSSEQQNHDSGVPQKKHREHEHGSSTVKTAQDSREREPKTRKQGKGSRASKVRGRENDATRDGERTTDESGQDTIAEKARDMQQENDKETLDKKGKERELKSRNEEPSPKGKEGEPPRTRQQRNNGSPSKEHDHTSTVVPHRAGESGHHVRKGDTSAVQQEHDRGVPKKRYREPKLVSNTLGTAKHSRGGEPKTRQKGQNGRMEEDRRSEHDVIRNGKLRSVEPGNKGEVRAMPQENDSKGLDEKGRERKHAKRDTEREHSSRVQKTENGDREEEPIVMQQDHGSRATEDKDTNHASSASELSVDQTERIDTDGVPESKQQRHGRKASEERRSKGDVIRDSEQGTGEAIHDRVRGAKQQKHGSGVSEETTEESDDAGRSEDTDSDSRKPRPEPLKHGGSASQEGGKQTEYTSYLVPQRTGEIGHHIRRGDAIAKQQDKRSGASAEISKERKYASSAEDSECREGEPRTRHQRSGTEASDHRNRKHDVTRDIEKRTGHHGRDAKARQQEHEALEKRGIEHGYGSKAFKQKARESASSDRAGYPRASNKERGAKASNEKSKTSKGSSQNTRETGPHGKPGEMRASQQEHRKGVSEEIIKGREYSSRAQDTERNARDGEQSTRHQEHGKRANEDRDQEDDVSRNGEQRNGKTSHMKDGEGRARQQDHGNGVLEEWVRGRGHGGTAGEIERDGRKREPRSIQQRHGVKANEEKGKERDVSRDGEQRTKDTGHDNRRGEARARQPGREYGSKFGEQRAGVSGQGRVKEDPRASRKERGGVVTDERGKEHVFSTKSGSQRTGESDHRPRRKDQRTRQSDQKVGGHEIRVGDHEARGGDFSVRASNNGARVNNPNSRSIETSARPGTTGARASLKDRINPRTRLGEPRLGLPAVKADEPAARSDQPFVKDNVDERKIRVSNVESVAVESETGGTGAAGVPRISEAQQHVRNSNVSERTPSMERKRYSSLRRPTPYPIIPLLPRKSEDKKQIETNKDAPKRKLSDRTPVSATNEIDKRHIQKETPKYPIKSIVPPAVPPPTANFNQIPFTTKSTSLTKVISNHKSLLTDSGPVEKAFDNNEIVVVSTNLFRNQESEITSMRLDTVKHVFDNMKDFPDEIIKLPQNIPSSNVNEGVQTLTELVSEAVDKHGHAVSSCKGRGGCTVSSQRDNTVATDDPKENFISILNKGDVVNLKLNIEVRNDQSKKPVNFCQKSGRKSRSLTNITRTEKCSQISIDDDILAQSKSLQSLLNNEYFRGCASDGRPKILVVQCACCGRSNNSPRDPPRSSDSKKYFVLLPNPHQQDKNERCNCETHGQSNSHKIPPQSQNSTSEHTIKKTLSNISLETLTAKGVSTHRRDLARYVATTNSTCQTEEPKSDCLIAKHRVSITENSGIRCEFQKESHSQISVITPGLVPEINCQNIQQYTCGSKHLDSHVPLDRSNPYAKVQAQLCPEICPDTCPLSPFHVCQPNCPQTVSHTQARPSEHNQGYSKVFPQLQSQGSSQTCQQVQSEGFSQAGQQFQVKECSQGCRNACSQGHLQVHSQTCTQVQSNSFSQAQSQEHPQTCSPTCPKGFPQVYPQIYLQVQSQGCQPTCLQAQSQTSRQKSSQGFPPIRREVSDSDTQTQWCSILLEARLHDDGRYSFHLPPLQVLKYYSF
nr:filaggrin-like isoform X1 [Helicoverpa armigera]